MFSFPLFFQQLAKSASILLDDVVVLAKPALSRIGDATMAAASAADDTVPLAKTAMKKASAVVVDDTAVSSDELNEASIAQHREYAVWRKIVIGSLVNKIVIMFVIMLTGAIAPAIPQIMLACGAAYLAYEGAHKVTEYAHHIVRAFRLLLGSPIARPEPKKASQQSVNALPTKRFRMPAFIDRFLGQDPKERAILLDLVLLDAILSTEIILVANGTLGEVGLMMKLMILAIVGTGTTFGVYGVVLLIIRADNIAAYFADPASRVHLPRFAQSIHKSLPYLLKVIGVIGTTAMLGVAGDVTAHLLPLALEAVGFSQASQSVHDVVGAISHGLKGSEMIGHMFIGLVVGALLVGVHRVIGGLRCSRPSS